VRTFRGSCVVVSARIAATGAARHTHKCSVLISVSIPRALREDDRDFYKVEYLYGKVKRPGDAQLPGSGAHLQE
jgi:hypothetical protein